MAIDFTQYQPPGIYTESLGGPQLSVRSSVPIAVAIFGLSVGYQTHRQSVTLPADVGGQPALSTKLDKVGINTLITSTSLPVVFATVNVDLTDTPATIEGLPPGDTETDDVTVDENDLVYLNAQTNATQNGLYKLQVVQVNGSPVRTLTPAVDTFQVSNPDTGVAYINGLDYNLVKIDSGDQSVISFRDDQYAIRRVDRGTGAGIQPGKTVQVSYRYTNPDYFNVKVLYDYDDVRETYGEPFNPDGSIRSELTLAAKFAFLNGASTMLLCAVDDKLKDSDNQPLSLTSCYEATLKKFLDEPQIAIIVPATGNTDVFAMVKEHVTRQSNSRFERRAILGTDGTQTALTPALRIGHAENISSSRIAMVSPSVFDYAAPELDRAILLRPGNSLIGNGVRKLGGQFMAAAVAGRSVSQIAAMPLTRKAISGFVGPSKEPVQREGDKNLETQNGLMVVEKTRRNQVQVRHGVTTDPTDLLSREWSIIGQQDVMVYRVRDYLDADGLIGMPIYDTTLIQVKASTDAALTSLVRDQIIVSYQNLKVRQLATLPDVIEVRYEWLPAYPLNYILVKYSVSVLTGDVTASEDATAAT